MLSHGLNYLCLKIIDDFVYYEMKYDESEDCYTIIIFKHDCKYNVRKMISAGYYDRETNKFIRTNTFSNSEMIQYPRATELP